MASKTAILAVRIIGDAKGGVAATEQISASSGRMEQAMGRASAGAGIALGAIGSAAFAAAQVAADAEQQVGAVDAVFKEYADRMHGYADVAAETVGLSRAEYQQMASVIGAQLKNMGLNLDEAAERTDWLIGLGADLAAQFGGSTADAVGALSSLLRGERDPIERYAVSINQAAIDAKKMEMGLDGLEGTAARNADLQATLALLTQQTADAQGAFGRESETAANKQQIANAKIQDAVATLGEAFLPLLAEGAEAFGGFATWAAENSELVLTMTAIIGGLAGAVLVIAAAMRVYAAAQAIQTAIQWANNAAWLANPIVIIILAIIAAIAALSIIILLVVDNWDAIKKAGEDAFNAIIKWVKDCIKWVKDLFNMAAPKWLKDFVGFVFPSKGGGSGISGAGGGSFAAASIAPMSMARSASPQVSSLSAAPAMGWASPASQRGPAGSEGTRVTNVTNNFNGLVTDREGTAREIRDVLAESDRTNGRTVAAGGKR